MSRRDDIITDVERMLGFYWEPDIAAKLGYAGADNLGTALRNWGRPDLARHFIKAHYDGLISTAQATAQAKREGAVI